MKPKMLRIILIVLAVLLLEIISGCATAAETRDTSGSTYTEQVIPAYEIRCRELGILGYAENYEYSEDHAVVTVTDYYGLYLPGKPYEHNAHIEIVLGKAGCAISENTLKRQIEVLFSR